MDVDRIAFIAKELLTKMKSEDFCGCYQGDIKGNYEDGVDTFITDFIERLKAEQGEGK